MRRAGVILILCLLWTKSALAGVKSIDRFGFTVSDMDRSVEFYTRVLDFEKVSDQEVAGTSVERLTGVFGARCRIVRLRLGEEEIELTSYLASPGRPYPADSRSNDRWFQHIAIIVSDMSQAYRRLRAFNIQHASTGPQRLPNWNVNTAGIKAFYFHDPDGHVLEILEFPAGKGLAQWQTRKGLFLGIDHSAIVVADTEKSLTFYRDTLGLKIAGASENSGDEQAHLNNVKDARLRITTLRAATGPAVELLEYLHPKEGKPYPADAKPNDLVHWQITATIDKFPAGKPEPVENQQLLRDPDGHALLFIARP